MTRHLVVIAGQRHYPWYMLQFVAAIFGQRLPKISQTPPRTPAEVAFRLPES